MEIFVGNIPEGTRAAELRKLLKVTLKGTVFRRVLNKVIKDGALDHGASFKITNKKLNGATFRYGHVVIPSDSLAHVALESLADAALRGSKLEVREYIKRNPSNDRRAINRDESSLNRPERNRPERRITERRITNI